MFRGSERAIAKKNVLLEGLDVGSGVCVLGQVLVVSCEEAAQGDERERLCVIRSSDPACLFHELCVRRRKRRFWDRLRMDDVKKGLRAAEMRGRTWRTSRKASNRSSMSGMEASAPSVMS